LLSQKLLRETPRQMDVCPEQTFFDEKKKFSWDKLLIL